MDQKQAMSYTESLLNNMLQMGLIIENEGSIQPPQPSSAEFYSAWILSRGIRETLHRYALVLTLLSQQQSISRGELEKKSRQFAERLSALHGLSSPEFFDKNVLATFVSALKENQLVDTNDNGLLGHTAQSESLCADVIKLIEPEIVQRLQKI
jgi:glycerol-3-phosphate O-acyltransferase